MSLAHHCTKKKKRKKKSDVNRTACTLKTAMFKKETKKQHGSDCHRVLNQMNEMCINVFKRRH